MNLRTLMLVLFAFSISTAYADGAMDQNGGYGAYGGFAASGFEGISGIVGYGSNLDSRMFEGANITGWGQISGSGWVTGYDYGGSYDGGGWGGGGWGGGYDNGGAGFGGLDGSNPN